MKKYIIFVILVLANLFFANQIASAQIVGTDAFLQGRFLEIGLCGNGAMGSGGNAPSGYHPHPGSGSNLAEVYDIGHDGWTVGTPPMMGDYTLPGSPFEGWEIQANGGRAQAYAVSSGYYFSGGCSFLGGITGYSNSGGTAVATLTGTLSAGGALLTLNMQTKVDTNASWVTTKVTLRNTSTSVVNNVYYFRSCDPDNDETWPGGGFPTDNWVTYQNDSHHRVLVSAVGYSSSHPYFGLGTIDSRAVAFVYNSWGLTVTQDLGAVWSQTYGPADYAVGAHDPGDIAIGLVFNLGSIAAGDSTTLSYAYLFKDSLDIDSTMGLMGGDTSRLDSFRVLRSNDCSGTHLTVYNNSYISGLTVKTYFGDGTVTTTPMPAYYSFSHLINCATISHSYLNSGIYTIKQVLYNGTTPIDSLIKSCPFRFCNDIHVNFYYDANNNCVKDINEPYVFQPFRTEIDSNGIPVDTISSLSGLYYRAYGGSGDVYKIKVLSAPAGFNVTCPSTSVFFDTLTTTYTEKTFQFGMSLDTTSGHDLQVFTSFRAGVHHFGGSVIVDNTMSPNTVSMLTVQLGPKYPNITAYPVPSFTSGTTATWIINLSNVVTAPVHINLDCEKSSGPYYTPGDTTNSDYRIDPIAGDLHPADNTCIRIDTIKSGYDPNYIDVSPEGYITAGTNLTYSIGFENTGNDTAHNIYIMDTLSGYLDLSSLRMIAASAYMDISKISIGGQTILKFDFPNIMLPDSSHHNQCSGLVIYAINTLPGLAPGTVIPAHAGIYFDDNDVVNTNTVTDIIQATGTLNIHNTGKDNIQLYPNPATDELTIKTNQNTYTSLTIANTLGQLMLQQPLNTTQTTISLKTLPSGIYYISLKGENGYVVRKFVKM